MNAPEFAAMREATAGAIKCAEDALRKSIAAELRERGAKHHKAYQDAADIDGDDREADAHLNKLVECNWIAERIEKGLLG
jgi:hypothetical protein